MFRHLMTFSLFLSLLSNVPTVVAAECNPSGSQLEMNQCALEDFEKIDTELNRVWQQLLEKEQANPAYIQKLRAAQRAWISFRDAEVAAMFACEDTNPRYCWGSMYPMLYHVMLGELTEERTQRLKSYLQDGQNPAVGE